MGRSRGISLLHSICSYHCNRCQKQCGNSIAIVIIAIVTILYVTSLTHVSILTNDVVFMFFPLT